MLVIPRSVRNRLVSHAREGRPAEVCGVLAGTRAKPATVERAVRMENVADAPRTTYAIDPEEQLAVMEDVEEAGLEVVGFYHSHPAGPDGPSETDAARATWDDHHYLIVSLADREPRLGVWRWTGETFAGEELRVE